MAIEDTVNSLAGVAAVAITGKVVMDMTDSMFGRQPVRRVYNKKQRLKSNRSSRRKTKKQMLQFGNFSNVGF